MPRTGTAPPNSGVSGFTETTAANRRRSRAHPFPATATASRKPAPRPSRTVSGALSASPGDGRPKGASTTAECSQGPAESAYGTAPVGSRVLNSVCRRGPWATAS
ncbi:hypothetical protein GCM10011578_063370 [Streptomyces fuscichromogenes]|uniref:Uncharacterized protein n=1 Tax=Streptomyces fuscichromogenes TaxID=1324013 RepID=A0A917XI55_9ACTN|nr:hypothetical protein GCM10011578_063370 [Streptomyces fuscichromogenes]